MNPRLFCREQSFHKTLLLTYSFDPIFFEHVVLPDLWVGRSSDILVLGDRAQIELSMESAAGQLWHLGRNYLLAGANHPGAFHPKVFLRLGPKDGLVMLSSGNVTSSGWGGNQELGTAWRVGPGHPDTGGWLRSFLDVVLSWSSDGLERDAVRRMRDVPWLSHTLIAPAGESAVVYSQKGFPLGLALAQRWTGRHFDEVKIITGSTDESGAFLRWAHTTFGVKRATVVLTPTNARFALDKLADLPLELLIIPASSDRSMHAKFYWFSGPSGPAAVMGSANCSAAAWLVAPENGGNIEALVAYDDPTIDTFESALSVFDAQAYAPADVLLPKSANLTEPDPNNEVFRLKTLLWDRASRRIHADISPAPASNMMIELMLGGLRLHMEQLHGSSGLWACELPDDLATATLFACVKISHGDVQWKTSSMWVNDLTSLKHASHAARLIEPFKDLERIATQTEQRRMLEDLQDVALALFEDGASFRDPGFAPIRAEKAQDDSHAAPLNPADLIVQLNAPSKGSPSLTLARSSSLSLNSILNLLFDTERDNVADSHTGPEEVNRWDLPHGTDGSASTNDPELPVEPQPHPIEDRFRERLAKQITAFLTEIAMPEFSQRCSATQMVQAVSFPLAVALRGQRRGWVSSEVAESWSLKVFSIIFRGKTARAGGLLRAVEKRYVDSDRRSIFEGVVGDGTLWMVLIATLGNANWNGVGAGLEKAIALREVFIAPQLLASAQQSRIAALLGKIRINEAHTYVAKIAPAVTQLLIEIETILMPIWKACLQDQEARSINHRIGEFLWRENVGWAICVLASEGRSGQSIRVRLRGVETNVNVGFYINVSELCQQNSVLRKLIEELLKTVMIKVIDGNC